jgi:glutamyl-tRNA reductase
VSVLACGFNHREMALAEREQWALAPESWANHLAAIDRSGLQEAVILSTCNRTELYAVADTKYQVENYFKQLYDASPEAIMHRLYWHESEAAVRHLMRVSSGLDSMCLGEPEILGQVKSAYQVACDAGAVGRYFRRLFPAVFAVSKQVRSETELGMGAVTLAYAVCQLVRQLYKGNKKRSVLCVGSGEIIDSMLKHLSRQQGLDIQIISRNTEKAQVLADRYSVQAQEWKELQPALLEADIVITATGSEQPIITTEDVKWVCENRRREEPLFFADLAVPRDIQATVGDLPGVFLYNLDDMQQVLEKNQKHRFSAVVKADKIIEQETARFVDRRKIAASAGVIKEFRSGAEDLREQCLERALSQLDSGVDAELIIRKLANDLTNKILHQPTLYLRDFILQKEK